MAATLGLRLGFAALYHWRWRFPLPRSVLAADPRALHGYYDWRSYDRTAAGPVWLPVCYDGPA
jgi:hypothetical protein